MDKTASALLAQAEKEDLKCLGIDFIGNGTYFASQLDLLQKRSVELIKSDGARLSARGLHHRSRKHFTREVQDNNAVIKQALKQAEKNPRTEKKSIPYLLSSYFQRAVSFERLGHIDRAIDDLTTCITIDANCAAAYFNRSGLLSAQERYEAALVDLDMAIKLEPANKVYRSNRALLLRKKGLYLDAIKDTITNRAMDLDSTIAKELTAGNDLDLDEEELMQDMRLIDPVVDALRDSKYARDPIKLKPVLDILRSFKCFSMISNNESAMIEMGQKLSLHQYSPGMQIGSKGCLMNHLFIVLNGEMKIFQTKMNKIDGDETTSKLKDMDQTLSDFESNDNSENDDDDELIDDPNIAFNNGYDFNDSVVPLACIHHSETFCKYNIEKKNEKKLYKTAIAMSFVPSTILTLSIKVYDEIVSDYNFLIKDEVFTVLSHSPVFSSWSPAALDKLSSRVVLRSYESNSLISKAGEPVKYLNIIRKGVVKLVKPLPRPDTSTSSLSQFSRPDSIEGDESPGLWVLEKNWRDAIETFDKDMDAEDWEKVDFTVGVLGSAQVFGELAVLDPEIRCPFSVVSFTNIELYSFASEDLIALGSRFNSTTMNALDESLNLHNPPGDKISYYFRSKFQWERKKEKILQEMSRERHGKIKASSSNNSQLNNVKLPKIKEKFNTR